MVDEAGASSIDRLIHRLTINRSTPHNTKPNTYQAVQWMRRAFPADHPYVCGMATNLATLRQERDEKEKGTWDPSKYTSVSIHRAGRV